MIWNSAKPFLALLASCLLLVGCGFMPKAGPWRSTVLDAEKTAHLEGIIIFKVTDQLARKLAERKKITPFSEVFGTSLPKQYRVGPGDVLNISIWEAPPAILFGSGTQSSAALSLTSKEESLPEQMVMEDGSISIPFVGRVSVAGKTVHEIEKAIAYFLEDKANSPHVMVRIAQNLSSQAAVLGDVGKSTNISLTPKRERVLDALAAAGGVTQPVNKISLLLSRAGVTATMPLTTIISDPRQNIPLRPGDVLTALFQPWTFSVLGATGQNAEIPFETQGISLAQALARSGGLNDNRADAAGVFVFRFEEPRRLGTDRPTTPTVGGAIPVIYQIDFTNPAAFFATQHFPIQDKDIVYVSNAPSVELEKFLRMVGVVLASGSRIHNM